MPCCSSFNRLPLKCLRKSVLRRLRGVGIKNPSIDFRMFSKAMDSPRIFIWNSGKKTGGDSDSRRFFFAGIRRRRFCVMFCVIIVHLKILAKKYNGAFGS